MIDKSLVKRRFKKSFSTYNDNAIVQKKMAERLIQYLPFKQYNSVLEIGCATGVLTKLIAENIKYEEIFVNDIVPESKIYIDNILPIYTFLPGDIETVNLKNKYDLIISNACLQWCNDISATTKKLYKLLNNKGTLAISVFGNENLKELKDIFGIKEKVYSLNELKQYLKSYEKYNIIEEKIELEFESLKEILQHLKYTGANSVMQYTLTKSKLQKYQELYIEKYSKNGKIVLTYNPIYMIIHT